MAKDDKNADTLVKAEPLAKVTSNDSMVLADMQQKMDGLIAEIARMKSAPIPGTVRRDRVKEHLCTLREYAAEDKVFGLVLKVFDVKEIKDKTEHRRFSGVCKLDVYEPKTGKTFVAKDVDYLDFLNNAKKVAAKVVSWDKKQRFEVDVRHGGGGVGPLMKQTPEREYVVDPSFEFEVGYTDHRFKLEVMEGAFEGIVFETDEPALNI